MTAMQALTDRTRHSHKAKLAFDKEGDIASLLNLPNMDAHKLWMATAHSKDSIIKEVRIAIADINVLLVT